MKNDARSNVDRLYLLLLRAFEDSRLGPTVRELRGEVALVVELAKAGDAKALAVQGLLALAGCKSFDDPHAEFGRKQLNRAARASDALANASLGRFYAAGAKKDQHLAFRHLSKALELGLKVVHLDLGVCYRDGCGVPKNTLLARKHFEVGALAGERCAMTSLGSMLLNSTLLKKEHESGRNWLERAAAKGDTSACWELYAHFQGDFERAPDIELAKKYIHMAALSGDVRAKHELGCLLFEKMNNPKDAISWLNQSAAAGLSDSYVALAGIYAVGKGHRDKVEEHLENAANLGHVQARNLLGRMRRRYRVLESAKTLEPFSAAEIMSALVAGAAMIGGLNKFAEDMFGIDVNA